MDEFKKFLRENRDKMDFETPDPQVWENLRKRNKNLAYYIIRLVAAASILLCIISMGYLMNDKMKKNELSIIKPIHVEKSKDSIQSPVFKSSDPQTKNKLLVSNINTKENTKRINHFGSKYSKTKSNYKKVDPETMVAENFGEMQKSFAIIINMQLNKVKKTPLYGEDANYFAVFKKEFQDLNSDEFGAKQEIKQNGLNDLQIEKLINIYQQKIILLKRLQIELNNMITHLPKKKDEKEKPTYINL